MENHENGVQEVVKEYKESEIREKDGGDLFKKNNRERVWSSLDKEESLACQITSLFNKKIGGFVKQCF